MTWATVALSTAVKASVGSGIISSIGSVRQGERQRDLYEDEAIRAQIAARHAERDLNKEASRILGRRRALQGAQGVTSEGTPRLVDTSIITETDLMALRIREGGAADVSRLQRQGGISAVGGVGGAIGSAVSGVARSASLIASYQFNKDAITPIGDGALQL